MNQWLLRAPQASTSQVALIRGVGNVELKTDDNAWRDHQERIDV